MPLYARLTLGGCGMALRCKSPKGFGERCSESWRSERLGRTLRSLRQLASCSIRALPPKFATRSSALIDSNRGTLSATAHWLARSRNVGVDIVESKSRTRALIALPDAAAAAARVAPAMRQTSAQTSPRRRSPPSVLSPADNSGKKGTPVKKAQSRWR